MRGVADSWRQNLFTDLLRSIRLRSSVYFRPELRAPWGFRIADQGTTFHIVVRGQCRLEVTDMAKPVLLSGGDFVVLPRGDAHAMRDAPSSRTVDFFDLVKRCAPDKTGAIRAGGRGSTTRLLCGGMQFENGVTDPLLALLPPLIHVKQLGERAAPWLQATVTHIVEELDSDRPGAETVVTRLADILFIQAVRAYLDENLDNAESRWLPALRDNQIGRALALLHAKPYEPWTVASLARRVAFSRSTFATKFAQLVGEPPLRHLTRLRLNAASARLRSSDAKLSAIAASVGYESVAAFVKAFKRYAGVTPGEYRRARRDGRQASPPREPKTNRRTSEQRGVGGRTIC